MAEIRSIRPWSETIESWQWLAESVTGLKVPIQLWRNLESWASFSRWPGLPPWHISPGCLRLKRKKFTIHLFLENGEWLDSRLPTFLHELGHIYLNHLPCTGKTISILEDETNSWRSLNFTTEMNLVERFIALERWGQKVPPSRLRRRIRGKKLAKMFERFGPRFQLSEHSKIPIDLWSADIRRGLEFHKWSEQYWAQAAEKNTMSVSGDSLMPCS